MNVEDAKIGARVRVNWEPMVDPKAYKGRVGIIKTLVDGAGRAPAEGSPVKGCYLEEEGIAKSGSYSLHIGWWPLGLLELVEEESDSSIYDLLMEAP